DNTVGSIFCREGDLDLSGNILPPLEGKRDVNVVFESQQDGKQYTFSANLDALDPSITAALEDKKTGIITNLRDSDYPFTHDKNFPAERFVVHFSKKASSVNQLRESDKTTVYSNSQGINIFYNNEMPYATANVTIYNLAGQRLHTETLNGNQSTIYRPLAGAPAIYVVSVTSGN